jgi:hypothetical protein
MFTTLASTAADSELYVAPGMAGVIVGLVAGLLTTILTLPSLFGKGKKKWYTLVLFFVAAGVVMFLLGISQSDYGLLGTSAVSFLVVAGTALIGYTIMVVYDVHLTTAADKKSSAELDTKLHDLDVLATRIEHLLSQQEQAASTAKAQAQAEWDVFSNLPRHRREAIVRRGDAPLRP